MNKLQLLVIGGFATIVLIEQVQLRDISLRMEQLVKTQPSADMLAAKAVEKFEHDLMAEVNRQQQVEQKRAQDAAKAFAAGVRRDMNSLNALAPDYSHGPFIGPPLPSPNASHP